LAIPLATYLRDHQAGALHAIEHLEAIRDGYQGTPMGEFASALLADVKSDQQTLREIADRVGAGGSGLKGLAAHASERLSRIKLSHSGNYGLGLFEALEFLELGIRGKWALWRALAAAASVDDRLTGVDFDRLIARAEEQTGRVEAQRIKLVQAALLRGEAPAANERKISAAVYSLVAIGILAIGSVAWRLRKE
jgi:hypothetical protein